MANEEKNVPTARGTVSRGRTVAVAHPSETRVVGRHPETGAILTAPKVVEYGPGAEVTLPVPEIRRLRSLGYLIDPDAKVLEPSEGPSFTEVQKSA